MKQRFWLALGVALQPGGPWAPLPDGGLTQTGCSLARRAECRERTTWPLWADAGKFGGDRPKYGSNQTDFEKCGGVLVLHRDASLRKKPGMPSGSRSGSRSGAGLARKRDTKSVSTAI